MEKAVSFGSVAKRLVSMGARSGVVALAKRARGLEGVDGAEPLDAVATVREPAGEAVARNAGASCGRGPD